MRGSRRSTRTSPRRATIGPFGIMDLIGIDTLWHAATFWAKQSPSDPQPQRYGSFLKGYMDKGSLGVKTGRGFYTYPNPAYQRAGYLA
ncbi:3-hydroxyacyl-CoA dehydrogenase family protein [Variovorax ureilyticus]|uniref:3-hydroxyacyl-CoA dehydrogenase family protein n=1 Tax=Variovorax ureilyticus TaxID=1836198 RepID=UPI003BF57EAB